MQLVKQSLKMQTKEPEVVDVANFLNSLGADIKGQGQVR